MKNFSSITDKNDIITKEYLETQPQKINWEAEEVQVKFKRCTTVELNSLPIVDGQLVYNTETGEIWQDVGIERRSLGSASGGVFPVYFTGSETQVPHLDNCSKNDIIHAYNDLHLLPVLMFKSTPEGYLPSQEYLDHTGAIWNSQNEQFEKVVVQPKEGYEATLFHEGIRTTQYVSHISYNSTDDDKFPDMEMYYWSGIDMSLGTKDATEGQIPVADEVIFGKVTKWRLEDKPSGGGTDISLGVTGATVGQFIQIDTVDGQGIPTAFKAVTINKIEGMKL